MTKDPEMLLFLNRDVKLGRAAQLMETHGKNLYSNGHLFVAAIRVWEHLNGNAPTLEDVCDFLRMSLEQGGYLLRRLTELDIVEVVQGSYGGRIFICNQLKLEDIPQEAVENKLDTELKKFQESQKQFTEKIDTMRAEQAEKKKSLYAEMEKKLKEELDKKIKP